MIKSLKHTFYSKFKLWEMKINVNPNPCILHESQSSVSTKQQFRLKRADLLRRNPFWPFSFVCYNPQKTGARNPISTKTKKTVICEWHSLSVAFHVRLRLKHCEWTQLDQKDISIDIFLIIVYAPTKWSPAHSENKK